MHRFNPGLAALLDAARIKGYATFQQVNKYLPDEGGDPEMVPELIAALEDAGLDVVDEPTPEEAQRLETPPDSMIEPETASSSRDPIRMYLSQMGHIPLLSREKEIFLAKQIELVRKWFRRKMMESDFALNLALETIKKVIAGELPFERTLRTSETEELRKEQIQGRIPVNIPTIERLMGENRHDWNLFKAEREPAVRAEHAGRRAGAGGLGRAGAASPRRQGMRDRYRRWLPRAGRVRGMAAPAHRTGAAAAHRPKLRHNG